MSSTNSTSHYELSQFVGSDKPAWLGDYNSDMSKIDTGIYNAQSAATGADGKADANTSAIGTLSSLTTDAKNTLVSAINEVDAHADTAQNTANNAVNASTGNTTAINALTDYLNLNTFTTPIATATGATITRQNISCAANSTGSLGKVYGSIRVTMSATNGTITFASPLRPTEAITVKGAGTTFYYEGSSTTSWIPLEATINIATDGTVTIDIADSVIGRDYRIILTNGVIFAKSFGDVPLPE